MRTSDASHLIPYLPFHCHLQQLPKSVKENDMVRFLKFFLRNVLNQAFCKAFRRKFPAAPATIPAAIVVPLLLEDPAKPPVSEDLIIAFNRQLDSRKASGCTTPVSSTLSPPSSPSLGSSISRLSTSDELVADDVIVNLNRPSSLSNKQEPAMKSADVEASCPASAASIISFVHAVSPTIPAAIVVPLLDDPASTPWRPRVLKRPVGESHNSFVRQLASRKALGCTTPASSTQSPPSSPSQPSMKAADVERWERSLKRATERGDRCEEEVVRLRELIRRQEELKEVSTVVRMTCWLFGLRPDMFI